jgi:hypothetical protein
MEKALPPKYAYVHGVRDVEAPADLKVHLRGKPDAAGRHRAARVPVRAQPRRARQGVHAGQRPLELADTIASSPLAMRVIVNRVWKGTSARAW